MLLKFDIPEGKKPITPTEVFLEAPEKTPEEGVFALVTIENFLGWLHTKQILPYPNNRGKGKVAEKTVHEVRDNLDLGALGMVHVAGNILCDFHCRAKGLHDGWCADLLSKLDMKAKLAMKTFPSSRFFDMYTKLNAQRGHTAGDKLENIDLALGREIASIISEVEPEYRKCLNRTKLSNLAYVTVGINTVKPADYGYGSFFEQRAQVRSLMNMEAGKAAVALSDDQTDATVAAINFYGKIIEYLVHSPTDVSTVKKSGPFFGLTVIDQLCKTPYLKKPKTVADRIVKHTARLANMVPTLTHRDKANMDRVSMDILKLLSRN